MYSLEKFVTRPVSVRAVQFDGTVSCVDFIKDKIGKLANVESYILDGGKSANLYIGTGSDTKRYVRKGWWIVITNNNQVLVANESSMNEVYRRQWNKKRNSKAGKTEVSLDVGALGVNVGLDVKVGGK